MLEQTASEVFGIGSGQGEMIPALPRTRIPVPTSTFLDQLIGSHQAWDSAVVYFQFPDSPDGYDPNSDGISGFLPLVPAWRETMRETFAELNHLLQVQFVEWPSDQPPPNANVIRIAHTTSDQVGRGGTGSVTPSVGGEAGNVWLGFNPDLPPRPPVEGEAYNVLDHELGHALGLRHPHEPTGALDRGGDAGFMWTIMSYTLGDENGRRLATHGPSYHQTFHALDILALQEIYGKNPVSDGDQTYRVVTDVQVTSETGGDPTLPPFARITFDDGNAATRDVSYRGQALSVATWDSGGDDSITFDGVQRAAGSTAGVEVRLFDGLLEAYLGPQDPDWFYVDSNATEFVSMPAVRILLDDQSWIETIVGSSYDDVFRGEGAARGLDIRAGAGADRLYGGAHNDSLEGGGGADTLFGGRGADMLKGGEGADVFLFAAGSGSDTILDLDATDRIDVHGYAGWRAVRQAGDDAIVVFSDTDTLVLRGVRADAVTTDIFTFNAPPPPTALTSPLTALAAPAPYTSPTGPTGPGSMSFRDDWIIGDDSDNSISGSFGSDRIEGLGGRDLLHGDGGHDILIGGDGDDYLFGEEGWDRLDGGVGNDFMHGGEGDDTFVFSAGSGFDTVSGFYGGGTADRIEVHGYSSYQRLEQMGAHAYVWFSDTDRLILLDTQVSSLTEEDFVFAATGGTFVGSPFADMIRGGGHDDRIRGGAGDDVIDGFLGDDRIDGGAGFDTVNVSGTFSSYRLLQNGDDFILKGPDGRDSLVGVERIRFGDGRTLDLNRMYGPGGHAEAGEDGWIPESLLSAGVPGDDRPLVLPGPDGQTPAPPDRSFWLHRWAGQMLTVDDQGLIIDHSSHIGWHSDSWLL